jgi:glucose/arabinose dehydrogenase/mono/diheme cytochrome c family protein
MPSLPTRLLVASLSVTFATALVSTQSPPPAPQTPTRPAQGGRGGFDDQAAGADFLKRPPVVQQDPDVEQQLFLLPPGFKIEPVLTDPLIQDPVGVTFDGNGRMYVLEMRSYMQDADGSNSRAPVSRISRHEDTDGDGIYDKHTVFVDNLVMPRIAFPLGDGVILALETDNRDMYKYTDTDGDGVADKKELFYAGTGRVTNMEWQPGGLTWALDNWLYMTYNPFRLRIAPDGKVLREETDPNGGQWWSAQDNYGKVWWVDGGGEIGPVNFQTPIAYGAFNVPDNFEPDFQVPWPAPGGIADMQGGMRRVRMPDGTLNHFTAASGVEIYRGDRLPGDLVGDLFFNEPVGRIVRRAKIVVSDGLTQLRNAYPKSEFIRSTDPLFRPVSIHNAPDGTLYLVDMYTGIIQDAQFVGPQSYLRKKVEQYALDRQHNWGRIWRITYQGTEPDRTRPRMYNETAAQLVAHLEHPNGWWRDTAQKLLVLKQDTSVVPTLKTMARTSGNQLARIHAVWTLEGLGSLDAALVRELMKSPDPQIRIQAIRASETLYKGRDKSFAADYKAMTRDPDPNVVIQAMLTLNLHKVPGYQDIIRSTSETSIVRGIHEIGGQILKGGTSQGQRPSLADVGAGSVNMTTENRRSMLRGEGTYRELCFTCHGSDGKGAPMAGAPDGSTLAPPLAGSARVLGHRDYIIKVLLNGLTGPLGDKSYPGGVMVPMGSNSDGWIADVASYVRNNFGNQAMFITPEQVAAARKTDTRKTPWTLAELEAAVPTLLTNTSEWKATASHNAEAAGNAITARTGRWDTGAPQQAGMWFQLELPEATTVTEVQLDSAPPGGGFLVLTPPGRGTPGGQTPTARGGQPPQQGVQSAQAPAQGGQVAPPGGQTSPQRGQTPPAGRGRGFGLPPARGPVGYTLQLSMDGTTWGAPVAQGAGTTPTTIISFAPTAAKFIRVTETGAAPNGEFWGINQIRVYGRSSH